MSEAPRLAGEATPATPDVARAAGPPHSQKEALVLLAVSASLAALALLVPEGGEGTFLKAVRPTLSFLAWTAPAYLVLEMRKRDSLVEHALLVEPTRLASSLGVALGFLPLYVLGFWLVAGRAAWHEPPLARAGWLFATQLPLVALPEEFFFRGALQPSLLPRRPLVSIVLVSAIFALAHVAFDETHAPVRLLVFFPSLVFGWLRARTGSIVPGVFFHALCNAIDFAVRGALS